MLHIVSAQGQLLPEYGLPPVVEVALAIQLEGSIGFRSLDLATIVARWADQLPDVQERAPLPMMGPGPEDAEVTLEVIDETQTPRLWLQNEAGNRVLQLQQDRVVVNWQKGGTDDPYPRYASIRESLVEAWGRLMAVVSDMGLVSSSGRSWGPLDSHPVTLSAAKGLVEVGRPPAPPDSSLRLRMTC